MKNTKEATYYTRYVFNIVVVLSVVPLWSYAISLSLEKSRPEVILWAAIFAVYQTFTAAFSVEMNGYTPKEGSFDYFITTHKRTLRGRLLLMAVIPVVGFFLMFKDLTHILLAPKEIKETK